MKSSVNNLMMTKEEVLHYFKDWKLDDESRAYFKYHSLRYEYLLTEIDKILTKLQKKDPKVRILDIGPAYQTELLRKRLPKTIVDSIGFFDPRFPLRKIDNHYQFDLNDAQDQQKWLKLKPYNLIIMAELIEHLYTSPKLVLKYVHTLLNKGGILIIQTPNAVSLDRRIKMLLGKHPYDLIREDNMNPGHFREYTIEELIIAAKESGFKVKIVTLDNYFVHKRMLGRIYDQICKLLPSNFKHGITLLLEA